MAYLSLDAGDGAELAELLRFLGDWLGAAQDDLAASLARFVGSDGYDVAQLRGDLDRFTFLLGGDDGDDGEPLFGPETGWPLARWARCAVP